MLCNRLKDLRKNGGLTQKEFAALFNLTESVVSLYESGKRQPSYQVLMEICKKCNVSADYLLGLSDIPATKYRYSKPLSSLISKLLELDDDDIASVSDYTDLILLRKHVRPPE